MTAPVEDTAVNVLELLDGLSEGVLHLAHGRIAGANRSVARMLGVAADALVGRAISEVFADPDGAALESPATGDAIRLRDARGDLVPVSVRMLNESVCLVVDRSRERTLEQEVWRLAGAPGERDGAAPFTSEIAGMIEHDMGTASTVLRGYLRMLLEERAGPLAEEQRSFVLEARRETDRMAELLANLLEFAASGKPDALRCVRKPARLGALLEQVVRAWAPRCAERGVALVFEPELVHDELRIDPGRIEQLITNLLSNALRFAPSGSAVRLAANEFEDEAGHALCVSVLDEGPGVTGEDADLIFRPFVRGAQAGGGRGVGLGLSVCRAIAAAHGGRVEAVPDQGCGHFRLILYADS